MWICIVIWAVDCLFKIHRNAPGYFCPCSCRHPDIVIAESTSTAGREIERQTIVGDMGITFERCTIDNGPNIFWLRPLVVCCCASGDPDVIATKSSWAGRDKVEFQAIGRETRVV